MEILEYSNKGCRVCNQDYVIHEGLSDGAQIIVVADGMGGYADGDIASQTVGNAIVEFIKINHGKRTPIEVLKCSLTFANDELMLKRMSLASQKMGTVVAVLYLIGDSSYITWLGDSRIYLFRDNQEVYRTEDHSLVNELLKKNTVRASDIERYRSIVTKSIMGEEVEHEAPIRKIKVEKGDVFVLCTDGFYKGIDVEKALSYEDSKKKEMDDIAECISDNYSFIKVVV